MLHGIIFVVYLQTEIWEWGLSSVGSEHLPYKQRVTGSNPVAPTKKKSLAKAGLFFSRLAV
jgi:hypothetical protein